MSWIRVLVALLILVWLILIWLILGPALAAEDRQPTPNLPFTVGAMQSVGGLCNAEGLKLVMTVQLRSGDAKIGGREFIRLVMDERALCRAFEPRQVRVMDITYIGQYTRLHLWIVKFGADDFALVSLRPR